MAVLEGMGFVERGQVETYWRGKARSRGEFCNERMARKIEAMGVAEGNPHG